MQGIRVLCKPSKALLGFLRLLNLSGVQDLGCRVLGYCASPPRRCWASCALLNLSGAQDLGCRVLGYYASTPRRCWASCALLNLSGAQPAWKELQSPRLLAENKPVGHLTA